jgi:segregation and condensation protein B
MNTDEAKAIIEAALLSASAPLAVGDLRRLFDDLIPPDSIRALVEEIGRDWSTRSLRLVESTSGWRFHTAPQFAPYLERLQGEKPARYSRAVMETLAIIAYRQPVTRGDIEDIRGVVVSSQIIRALEERGWIEVIGHKDVVGRPALFGTTRRFLDDLGLGSLAALPPLDGTPSLQAESPIQGTIDFDAPALPGPAADPIAAPVLTAPPDLSVSDLSDQGEASSGRAEPATQHDAGLAAIGQHDSQADRAAPISTEAAPVQAEPSEAGLESPLSSSPADESRQEPPQP